MKTTIQFVFCLFLVSISSKTFGQTSPCTANTPHFVIDLTGNPGGTAYIAPVQRQGLCCGAQSPDACIMATITLDSNSSGIRFDISSGAVPPGALYYQIGCNTPTKVGEPICLSGVGPHILTFCKPGNNSNGYSITALPKLIVPDTVSVDLGCSVTIGTLGYFVDTSLVWHDLSSTTGANLQYLDSTQGVDTVTVTPDINSPDFIQYEVCGRLIDTVCQSVSSYLCKTITVQVNKIIDSTTATICSNQIYTLPDGTTTNVPGSYVSTLSSSGACDSIVVTTLTVNPSYVKTNTMVSCDSAIIHGNWYFNSQLVIDSFTTVLGCDSIVKTTLIINYTKITNQMFTYCDSSNINGNWYYSSQMVVDSFKTSLNCDSIVYTDLTINYTAKTYLDVMACDSANINGNWYYSSQLVTDSFLTSNNCDSIVFTTLSIYPTYEINASLTQCDSAIVNGNWYFSSQLVTDSFSTIYGCDSILLTQLTINYSKETYLAETSCDSANINGNWYYNSQTVIDSFTSYEGCDSVVITSLTINYTARINQNITSCDSAFINGNWYFSSQTVVDSFLTLNQCDSIVTTFLSINPSKVVNLNLTECDRALINGNWYYSSQMVVDSFKTSLNCDSIVFTDLTIHYSDSTFLTVASCESAFVEGKWYYSTQMIYNHLKTYQGCDSTVVVKLSIYNGTEKDRKITACDSFKHNSTTYYETLIYTDIFQNVHGCDSIINNFITIHNSVNIYQDLEFCEGDRVYLPNKTKVNADGIYQSFFTTKYGCDSIIHSKITFNSTGYIQAPDTQKCLGDIIDISAGTGNNIVEYTWSTGEKEPVITVRENGTYYVMVKSANGCLSKDTLVVADANCPACPLYTPSGFSPDMSNLNDQFSPVSECSFLTYKFEIYNRWGELIYRTYNPTDKWDGDFMGKPVQQGVYVWLVNYTDTKAMKPISQSGTITLLR